MNGLSKNELAAKAQQTFKDHPKEEVVIVTSDGHAFLRGAKGLALDHARKNAGQCYEYKRDEVEGLEITVGGKPTAADGDRETKENEVPMIGGKNKSEWKKTKVGDVESAIEKLSSEELQKLLDEKWIDTVGGRGFVQAKIDEMKVGKSEGGESEGSEGSEGPESEDGKSEGGESEDGKAEESEGEKTGEQESEGEKTGE